MSRRRPCKRSISRMLIADVATDVVCWRPEPARRTRLRRRYGRDLSCGQRGLASAGSRRLPSRYCALRASNTRECPPELSFGRAGVRPRPRGAREALARCPCLRLGAVVRQSVATPPTLVRALATFERREACARRAAGSAVRSRSKPVAGAAPAEGVALPSPGRVRRWPGTPAGPGRVRCRLHGTRPERHLRTTGPSCPVANAEPGSAGRRLARGRNTLARGVRVQAVHLDRVRKRTAAVESPHGSRRVVARLRTVPSLPGRLVRGAAPSPSSW
ncbi:hypothetical protein SALBM311S_12960 [Streptomyces alboniger]